jgi:hypothetical protein
LIFTQKENKPENYTMNSPDGFWSKCPHPPATLYSVHRYLD